MNNLDFVISVKRCGGEVGVLKMDEATLIAIEVAYNEGREAGIASERERCAKICSELASDTYNLYKGLPPYKGDEEGRASDFVQGRSAGAEDCAEKIRDRKEF